MGEGEGKRFRGRRDFGRKWPEPKVDFPTVPYPEGSKITVKTIAFLHAYCGKAPVDIAARYPRAITLAQVHLGIYHYLSNREAIDAAIKEELAFNARDTLRGPSMTLPRVNLPSLVESLHEDASDDIPPCTTKVP